MPSGMNEVIPQGRSLLVDSSGALIYPLRVVRVFGLAGAAGAAAPQRATNFQAGGLCGESGKFH